MSKPRDNILQVISSDARQKGGLPPVSKRPSKPSQVPVQGISDSGPSLSVVMVTFPAAFWLDLVKLVAWKPLAAPGMKPGPTWTCPASQAFVGTYRHRSINRDGLIFVSKRPSFPAQPPFKSQGRGVEGPPTPKLNSQRPALGAGCDRPFPFRAALGPSATSICCCYTQTTIPI